MRLLVSFLMHQNRNRGFHSDQVLVSAAPAKWTNQRHSLEVINEIFAPLSADLSQYDNPMVLVIVHFASLLLAESLMD